MHKMRFILIGFMAVLAACFTIELPFTQVNYIHLLVNKKERGITNALKDSHRLHKTYYEDAGQMLLPLLTVCTPCIIPASPAPVYYRPHDHTIDTTLLSYTLRGPPAQV